MAEQSDREPAGITSKHRAHLLKFASRMAVDPRDAEQVCLAAYRMLLFVEQASDAEDLDLRMGALGRHFLNLSNAASPETARVAPVEEFIEDAAKLYGFLAVDRAGDRDA